MTPSPRPSGLGWLCILALALTCGYLAQPHQPPPEARRVGWYREVHGVSHSSYYRDRTWYIFAAVRLALHERTLPHEL